MKHFVLAIILLLLCSNANAGFDFDFNLKDVGSEQGNIPTKEYIVNGDFSTLDGWNLVSGWTISGGVGNANAAAYAAIYQNLGIAGKSYLVSYEVVSVTSGSVGFGNSADSAKVYRSTPGIYREVYYSPLGKSYFAMQAGPSGFVGSIDNVSVKEILQVGN